ncbi:MAG: ABC transporter permease [Salibacteraceae bacterium]
MNLFTRLMRQPLSIIGFAILLVVVIVAFLGSLIRPDASVHASQQNMSLTKLKPLTTVDLVRLKVNRKSIQQPWHTRLFLGGVQPEFINVPFDTFYVKANELTIVKNANKRHYHLADVFYAIDQLTLTALRKEDVGNYAFYNMENQLIETSADQLESRLMAETVYQKTYFLGTDALGRDMLSRLMAGSALSLSIGFFSVLIAIVIGISIGVISGYFGGYIDLLLSWVINLFWSVPAILFVIMLTISLGTGWGALIIGIGMVLWVEMAQVIRQSVRSMREKEYIKASRLLGLSHTTILMKHILPNLSAPIFVLAASTFADAIVLEAGLSFLGIGIEPPQPSWGNMIRESYGYIISEGSTHLAIIPSLALMIMVLAFVFLSQGLKDAMSFSFQQKGRGSL